MNFARPSEAGKLEAMQPEFAKHWSRYLIYVILAVLPLERIPSFDLTHPLHVTIRLSQIAGAILILLNLPEMWRQRGQLRRGPWLWLAAFLLVCVVSAGLATDLKRAVSVAIFTIFVGILSWVISLRFERDKLPTYLKILVISALVTCAFGLYQFFGDLFGLSTQWTGLRPQYTKAVFGFPRIQSTGLEPLYYGDYLLVPVGILAGVIAVAKRRIAFALALVPMLAIVWLSVSRGAIVAMILVLLIGCGLAAWQRRYRSILWLIGSAILSVGIAYLLLFISSITAQPTATQTHNSVDNFSKQATNISNGESSEGRTVTRNLAIKAFTSHPLLGLGPGNFGHYAATEMPTRFGSGDAIVNNEPLEIAAETGTLGILTLLGFLIITFWLVVKRALIAKPTALELAVLGGLTASLIGIAAQYMTFSTLYITHIWVALGLLIGLATSLGTLSSQKAHKKR